MNPKALSRVAEFKQEAINVDHPDLIDENGPTLMRWTLFSQRPERGGLPDAEETTNQMDNREGFKGHERRA